MNNQTELKQACEESGITVSSRHLYVDYSDEKNPHDKWECTLHYKEKSVTFEFATECGHRVCALGVKNESKYGGLPKYWHNSLGEWAHGYREAIEKKFLVLKRENGKIVGPDVADVVYSNLICLSAMEEIFDDWAENLGLSKDSISGLQIYLTSQRHGMSMYRLLGTDLVQELREKEH